MNDTTYEREMTDLALYGGKPIRPTMLPYGHQCIYQSDIAAVVDVLRSDTIARGQMIERFEQAVADYCGAKYAVGVSSGTAALHAACAVAGVQRGSLVLVPVLTFAATANAAIYCGALPHFADVKADTLCIDPEKAEWLICPETRAIIPVDFAGHPAEMDEIMAIAKKHDLIVIEDACHSLGATYKGRKVGTLADMTCFSFHPVKAITTGEGGMVVTDNSQYNQALRQFRNHGIARYADWGYDIESLGYNYWMSDIAAALGLSQMGKLDEFLDRRMDIVLDYDGAFQDMPEVELLPFDGSVTSAWHLYVIQLRLDRLTCDRDTIIAALRAEGIGATVHYKPLHLHSYYQRRYAYTAGSFPVAEDYYRRAVTLPLFPAMTDQDVQDVIEAVKKVIGQYKR